MIEWLVLISLNILLLIKTIQCGAVVDDDGCISSFRATKKNIKEKFKNWNLKTIIKEWKFIIGLIKQFTYGAGATRNSAEDHAISIFINTINTLLVYKLTGSFMCALLWLCNPVNNQISIWLNGRRYSLSIMFVLLAVNYKILFIPFIGLAGWIHVISAPAFLFSGSIWVSLFALGVFALAGYKQHKHRYFSRKKDFSSDNELQKITPMKAIIYLKTFGYYVTHMLFPVPKMYHKHLYYFGRYEQFNKRAYSLDFEFCKGLAIFGFFAYEMAMGNFWAFWFVLFISQWCGITTVTMNAADRYCSLPMIGLLMIFIKYVSILPAEYQITVYAVFTTAWIVKYIRLHRAYVNVFQFYDYHLEINPACIEARTYMAEKLAINEPFKALTLINDGLKYCPCDFKLLISMVLINARVGRYDQAEKYMSRAEQFIPIGEEEDTKREFARLRKDIAEMKIQQLPRKTRRELKKRKKC